VDKLNVCAGVVVAVATEVVNNGDKFPLLKVVTVPAPAGDDQLNTVPLVDRNCPECVACEGKSLKSAVVGCAAENNPVLELYAVKN
jgi:hypothetical protein